MSHSSCCRALPRGRMATIPWPRGLQMMRTAVTSGKCTCVGKTPLRPFCASPLACKVEGIAPLMQIARNY